MTVTLTNVTNNPVMAIEEAASNCYNSKPTVDGKIMKGCYQSGHTSVLEFANFTFHIEDVSRACYDEKTEILTSEGWKFFKDLQENEIVATLNKDTNKVEFNPINEKISYLYTGKIHHIKSQSVDLRITDNHNLYYRKQDSISKYNNYESYLTPINEIKCSKIVFDKMFTYENNFIDENFKIPNYIYQKKLNNGTYQEKTIVGEKVNRLEFYKFLAWYLSDGSVYYDKNEKKYIISITQTNCKINQERNTINRIREICKKLGFNTVYSSNKINITNRPLGAYLEKLGVSGLKYIPFNIFKYFNKDYAQAFLNEYFLADGSIDNNFNTCRKLYTSSKQLADQLYNLVYIAGWSGKLFTRYKNNVGETIVIKEKTCTRNYPSYIINVSCGIRNSHPHIQLKDQRTIENVIDEPVYCVNVKNHIIFVRRNGISIWCGNCLAQLTRHRHAGYAVRSQRYCVEDDFDYIVPKSIENNELSLNTYQNIMGDINTAYIKLIDLGIIAEDARYVLPNACYTTLEVTMNLRALINFMNERLCSRAQWEIRELAQKMRDLIIEPYPKFKPMLVPKCEKYIDYPFCTEQKSCGKHKKLKEVYNAE